MDKSGQAVQLKIRDESLIYPTTPIRCTGEEEINLILAQQPRLTDSSSMRGFIKPTQKRLVSSQFPVKGKLRWPDSNSMFRSLSCNRTTSKEWSLPQHWRGHDKQWIAGRMRKFNRRNEGYLQRDNEIKNTPSISQH
jgi:hypothetical protein